VDDCPLGKSNFNRHNWRFWTKNIQENILECP